MRRAILLVSLVSVATCAPISTGPVADNDVLVMQLPADSASAIRFDAPPIYLMWYAQVMTCSGIQKQTLPMFWVANRVNFIARRKAIAFYDPRTRSVILGLGNETVDWIVRHEMLHDLEQSFLPLAVPGETYEQAQHRMHPVELFGRGTTCGVLVNPPESPVGSP